MYPKVYNYGNINYKLSKLKHNFVMFKKMIGDQFSNVI